MNPAAVTFAVVLPALLVAHHAGDYWAQTSAQARDKGLPGWPGRWACAKHVASYTACTAATVGLLWVVFGLPITWWGFLVGQVVSAGTHYWADRRFTLARLATRLGKGGFYLLGAPRSVWAYTDRINGEEHPVTLDIRGGAPQSWDNPTLGTGAHALDQSWHWVWLGAAALVTALV